MSEPFQKADWRRLRALRERFLADATADYWKSDRELELYDAVYAQRIGWKWDAVLEAIDQTGWKPRSTRLIDWGCGTGIASHRVAQWSGIRQVAVYDESRMASRFAATLHAANGIITETPSAIDHVPPASLLVLSHVIGELKDSELERLTKLAKSAEEVLWVEPGSHELSRKLGQVRDALVDAGHRVLAPCTHQSPCPMFQPDHEKDWCHFFAAPPVEIFQSAFWRRVSEEVKIDLRALPYSYLATSKHPAPAPATTSERVIGRPTPLKAHCKLLCCGREGLHDRTLQKRDAPALYRAFTKDGLEGAFTWTFIEGKPGYIAGTE